MFCPVCTYHKVEEGKRMNYEIMRDKYIRIQKYWCPMCQISFGVQVKKNNAFIQEERLYPNFEEYYV